MSVNPASLGKALRDYRRLRELIPIGPLRNRREYQRAVHTLDTILDQVGGDDRHPMAELAETIGTFIERYEQEHLPLRPATAAEVLGLLMEQHQLRQSDLPEVGSQGVVSEVLAGKRVLNARQIRRLAERFGVSAAVFLG